MSRNSRIISTISIPVTLAVLLAGNLIGPVVALAWIAITRTPWADIGCARWPTWLRDSILAVVGGAWLKVLLKTVVVPPLGVPAVNSSYHFHVGNSTPLPRMILYILIAAGIGEDIVWPVFFCRAPQSTLW